MTADHVEFVDRWTELGEGTALAEFSTEISSFKRRTGGGRPSPAFAFRKGLKIEGEWN
jgi:hypothetical protein